MKNVALAVVLALLVPAGARALDTRDFSALVAMPVAVAAASEISGVPRSDLVDVVVAMNRANVPPPQFVEVVRYVPVALVEEPQFVTFVTSEVDRGIVGNDLAVAMSDRFHTYGVDEINVVDPPDIVVIERYNYVPASVTTRLVREPIDPLALVAMPLAVAAVSQLTNMPTTDLFRLITSLNRAYVPPAQFVEVVRYSPLVLYDDRYRSQFVPFVTTQIDRGFYGVRLANVIGDQYRTWGITELDLVRPSIRIVDGVFPLPPIVMTRAGHPHGGPPGQLKKQLGLQTGAEVVHGTRPGARSASSDRGSRVKVKEEQRSSDRIRVRKDDGREKKVAPRPPKHQQPSVNRGAAAHGPKQGVAGAKRPSKANPGNRGDHGKGKH